MKTSLLLLLLATAFVCVSVLPAQDPGPEDAPPAPVPVPVPGPTMPEEEKAIPTPYPASRYEAAWAKNPFLLKTVAPAQPTASFADDWALAGMSNLQGKLRVTLQNKQTGEYKRLTGEGGESSDLKLIKANFSKVRSEQFAEISNGTETATIKFDDALVSRPLTVVATGKPGAPGAPGVPVRNLPGGGAAAQPGARPGVTLPGGQPQAAGMPGSAFNRPGVAAPQVGGGVVTLPGAGGNINVPTGSNPNPVVTTSRPGVNPPTISRRRQLIPAPISQ